jgi:tight adherence protein B
VTNSSLVFVSALGFGLGIAGVVWVLFVGRRTDLRSISRRGERESSKWSSPRTTAFDHGSVIRRVLPAAAAGVLTLVLTRWPVAGLLAAVAVAFAPSVLGRTSSSVATGRIEAVATWTELLRDTLAASAGLGEAIMATAPVAPGAIREQVVRLADRLTSGVAMSEALRVFAAEVDDSSCDMVACALLLAASARTQKLTDLLGALSESIREEVAMRLRVESSRASSRSSVRTVVVFSVLFAVVLVVTARSYLEPLGTATGEVILLAVGVCYATGIALMLRLVRPRAQPRLLGPLDVEARANRGGATL